MAGIKHHTDIEWTHLPGYVGRTWIPITGCSIDGRVECINCYAMKLAGTRLLNVPQYANTTQRVNNQVVWSGQVNMIESRAREPLHWTKPSAVFLTSMGDLFHRNVTREFVDRLMAVAVSTQRHVYLILSKRSLAMAHYIKVRSADPEPLLAACRELGKQGVEGLRSIAAQGFPTRNLFWGTSVGTQAMADAHLPPLANIHALVPKGRLWISQEPALEPINFDRWFYPEPVCEGCPWDPTGPDKFKGFNECCRKFYRKSLFSWVVTGGESHQPGRPGRAYDCAIPRSTRDQCHAAGVPFFHKQLGGTPVNIGLDSEVRLAQMDKHNGDWSLWPDDLKVRQFPLL